jgi:hypothetical protein
MATYGRIFKSGSIRRNALLRRDRTAVRRRVNVVSGDRRKNRIVQLVRHLSASGLVRDYVALITRFESKGGSRVFRRHAAGIIFRFLDSFFQRGCAVRG